MAYISSRSSYMDEFGGAPRRGHRDSDATLIDDQYSDSNAHYIHDPVRQHSDGDNRREEELNYDQFLLPYFDSQSDEEHSSQSRRNDSSSRYNSSASYSSTNNAQRSTQESLHYHANSNTNDHANNLTYPDNACFQDSQRRQRSVRFDVRDNYGNCFPSDSPHSQNSGMGDSYRPTYSRRCSQTTQNEPKSDHREDYNYGYVQDDDNYDDRYSAVKGGLRLDERGNSYDVRARSLPRPATAPQETRDAVQNGFFPFMMSQQKEKKASLTKRIRQALIALSLNPDDVALGCRAGRPTPQHILDKEAEEEAIEEEKRQEACPRREEDVRRSMMRRETSHSIRSSEERERQQKAQSLRTGSRRGTSYDARIAEDYAREVSRLREYDIAHDLRRGSRNSSRDTRSQCTSQQHGRAKPF